jgi:hypothetical protein
MKTLLTLGLGALMLLGLMPASSEAAYVEVSSGSSYGHHTSYHGHRQLHRRTRRVVHAGYWSHRRGHRVWIPARTVIVRF